MTPRPASPAAGTRRHILRSTMWQVRVVPILAGTLVLVGFALLTFGWRSAAATVDLQAQIAYVISGGLLGIALLGIGCGLGVVHADRWATRKLARAHRLLAAQCRRLEGHFVDHGQGGPA